MTKNPILNALAATLYITIVSLVMFFGTRYAPKEDTFLAPIAILSLFTLSAAVMVYVFCKEPLLLYIESKKKQAIRLFIQTLAVFAIITTLALILLFSGIIK